MQISYLLTNKQVMNYLTNQGLDATDSNFNDNVSIYRLAAYKKICNYVGYDIIENVYETERYNGNGLKELYFINRPVTSLSEFKLCDNDITDDVELIGNKVFYEDGYFTRGLNNIKVTYTAGYNLSTMPADIRLSALQLISLYSGQLGGAGTTIGKSSVSDGNGGSESIDTEAETRILSALTQYVSHVRL